MSNEECRAGRWRCAGDCIHQWMKVHSKRVRQQIESILSQLSSSQAALPTYHAVHFHTREFVLRPDNPSRADGLRLNIRHMEQGKNSVSRALERSVYERSQCVSHVSFAPYSLRRPKQQKHRVVKEMSTTPKTVVHGAWREGKCMPMCGS